MNFDQWWVEKDVARTAALLDQNPRQVAEAAWLAAKAEALSLRRTVARESSYDEGWNDAIDAAAK